MDAVLDDATVRVAGLPDDRDVEEIVTALVSEQIGVHGVRRDEQTLESVFMDLTSGGGL